ncbi:hypothetical protein TWF569_005378 [Orbilia oligospora]|nr:hypothetical protein TWF706_005456 [Orbilia oligospora]KAF3101697.1 hypothetical protein TWF706_005456 [Orbilia oligospora]KAF3148643.1 hypothetical protein TWF569_005378 [Orbilia oligospora]
MASSSTGAIQAVVDSLAGAVLGKDASQGESSAKPAPVVSLINERISGEYKLQKGFEHKSASSCTAYLQSPESHVTKYGASVPRLKLEVEPFTTQIARIRITDADRTRWEIPDEYVPIGADIPPEVQRPAVAGFDVSIKADDGDPGFTIFRKSDNVPVFDTRGISLAYTEQYIEVGTKLPKGTFVYGMGEVTGPFCRETGHRYAFWSRDAQTPLHENSYSSMPMFIGMHNGKAFGIYLHNSNALDMIYTKDVMTYKIVGGIVDFFVFLGESYEDVVKQYQQVTGFPQLPPYWSLGYHQCRWYYTTTEKLDEVRQMSMQVDIPVDVFWLDIDYMIKYRLFTLEEERYPSFIDYIEREIHKDNHKLVAILDPGVKNNVDDYYPWTRGKELDIFLKNGNTGGDFVGKVWPGHVVFPDWVHPKIHQYWTEMLREWFKSNFANGDVHEAGGSALIDDILIPTDTETVDDMAKAAAEGVEIDPNAMQRGEAKPEPPPAFDPTRPAGLTNPPYSVNHGGVNWPLHARSISVDATHYGGVLEYNVHNLFGHLNCRTSYNSMLEIKPDERPFILTRSAFAGTGKYASKWLGDNFSHWDSMRYSISGILNMQMFGIPHIGADIGGFNGGPSEELLVRWFQLGSMYPFCRNHNMPNTPPQEAYVSAAVATVARKYLTFRYRILPFWYTAFAKVKQSGGSVVQPVWAVYPPTLKKTTEEVKKIYEESNDAFLINKKLLVLPVVRANEREVNAWFPRGVWYDALTGKVFSSGSDIWRTVSAPLDTIPLFFRGGSIIPMHYNKSGQTTVDFRNGGLSLAIYLDSEGKANGDIHLDDGKTFSSKISMVTLSAHVDPDLNILTLKTDGRFEYLSVGNPDEDDSKFTLRKALKMMWGTIKGNQTAKRHPQEEMYASSGEEEEGVCEVEGRARANSDNVQDLGAAELTRGIENVQDLAGNTLGATT